MPKDKNGKEIKPGDIVKRVTHGCPDTPIDKEVKVLTCSEETITHKTPSGGVTIRESAYYKLVDKTRETLPEKPTTEEQKKALEIAKEEMKQEEIKQLTEQYKQAIKELKTALNELKQNEEEVEKLMKALNMEAKKK